MVDNDTMKEAMKEAVKSNLLFVDSARDYGFGKGPKLIRKADINKVAEIWLDTNIKAQYFIPAHYWESNFELVKKLLLQATVYVYEDNQEIQGFIGLNAEYIEGIFVCDKMQSQG